MQLLQLPCEYYSTSQAWLVSKHSSVNWETQNEILQIMRHEILLNVKSDINSMSSVWKYGRWYSGCRREKNRKA